MRFAICLLTFSTLLLGSAGSSAQGSVVHYNHYWNPSILEDQETLTWTFDFTELEFNQDTVINGATLSIRAFFVDEHPDPVVIEMDHLLGYLDPGQITTTFELPEALEGMSGSYKYLQDGQLEVSLTASEFDYEWKQVEVQETYQEKYYYKDHHGRWRKGYRTKTHTKTKWVKVYKSGGLIFKDSKLTIDYEDAIVPEPKNDEIPEPSALAALSGLALCFGVAGRWRKRRPSWMPYSSITGMPAAGAGMKTAPRCACCGSPRPPRRRLSMARMMSPATMPGM